MLTSDVFVVLQKHRNQNFLLPFCPPLSKLSNKHTDNSSLLCRRLLSLDVAYLQATQLRDLRDFEVNICCQSTDDLQRDRQCFLVEKDQREFFFFGNVFSRCLPDECKQHCASLHPREWKVWLNVHVSTSLHQRCYSKMCFPLLSNTSTRCVNRFLLSGLFSFPNLLLCPRASSFLSGLALRVFVFASGWAVEQEEEELARKNKTRGRKTNKRARSCKFHFSLRLPLSPQKISTLSL